MSTTAAEASATAYGDVDVAIMAESTYPYLKGGVSAVIHDIVTGNQDTKFGIIHITWDAKSEHRDLYGMPSNVAWVRPVYLAMHEHRDEFMKTRPTELHMRPAARRKLCDQIVEGFAALLSEGDPSGLWKLYDEGLNPRTRTYPLWALLGTKEFMLAIRHHLAGLGLPLVDTFWLLREFFSLAFAILHDDMPRADVYHAHTTGYASLLGAAAARQNGTKFLLTEHNLYVRDTINGLLDRSMALTVTSNDWREFDVPAVERAWMAWWTEMGHFCYPSAEVITYLYPSAITEAAGLRAPVEKAMVIPNGMSVDRFDDAYQKRLEAIKGIVASSEQRAEEPERVWQLAYIARVVPIKGLSALLDTVDSLVRQGCTNFHLQILGPTDHDPAYYMLCREKARRLGVEGYLTFRGTVNVMDLLGEIDLLVMPSFNEGQPIVALEAMTAGIPIVGTQVGGMAELVLDPLTTPGGRTWGPCGKLVTADHLSDMADVLRQLMSDTALYAEFAANGRGRVENFYLLDDVVGAYNRLYKELAGHPAPSLEDEAIEIENQSRVQREIPTRVLHPSER